jgi:hypothetical protein
MEKTIKINMPFDKWCKLQKDFERVNASLPENQRLDFEKYKFCTDWGKLSFDLYGIEIGAFKELKEPVYYTRKEKLIK